MSKRKDTLLDFKIEEKTWRENKKDEMHSEKLDNYRLVSEKRMIEQMRRDEEDRFAYRRDIPDGMCD